MSLTPLGVDTVLDYVLHTSTDITPIYGPSPYYNKSHLLAYTTALL